MQGDYNYSNLSCLLGDGIFTVDGDKWKQQRKISSYEFSTKVLRDFSSVVFRKNAAKLANIVSEAAKSEQSMDIQASILNLVIYSKLINICEFIDFLNLVIRVGFVYEINLRFHFQSCIWC